MSDCGKYMIVSIVKACRDNLLYFADLEKNGEITGKIPLTPIVTEFEADYDVSCAYNLTKCSNVQIGILSIQLIYCLNFSISQILDQKWCFAPIKMHQIIVSL